jgi:ADP-ribose pyrophosphatase YjhB (NUDIX family)
MANVPVQVNDLLNDQDHFLPAVSIDNVIFGFYQNELKVLLLQSRSNLKWMLPGGFIGKDEDLDEAATRILSARTGLTMSSCSNFTYLAVLNGIESSI